MIYRLNFKTAVKTKIELNKQESITTQVKKTNHLAHCEIIAVDVRCEYLNTIVDKLVIHHFQALYESKIAIYLVFSN